MSSDNDDDMRPIERLTEGIGEQIEHVERYEIGPSKEVHVTDLYEWRDALDELIEEWACDDCGVRKSTCSKGDRQLCNECAGLTLEDSRLATDGGQTADPRKWGHGEENPVMCQHCGSTWVASTLYKTGDVLRCPDCDGVMRP